MRISGGVLVDHSLSVDQVLGPLLGRLLGKLVGPSYPLFCTVTANTKKRGTPKCKCIECVLCTTIVLVLTLIMPFLKITQKSIVYSKDEDSETQKLSDLPKDVELVSMGARILRLVFLSP